MGLASHRWIFDVETHMSIQRTASRPADYRVDPFDLQLFEAVVARGSITAGAGVMCLSLAAASGRIKALEERVGVKLLERSKSGVVATEAGRSLSRQAHRVLLEIDSLHAEMSAFGRGLRGRVRLFCNTAAMVQALPPRLGEFLHRFPEVDVELQEMASDGALGALREGLADVAIVANHVDTGGLVSQPSMDDELVAVLPCSLSGDGAVRAVRFADLLDQPFVGLGADAGLSRFILAQAARSGRVPHHRVRVAGFEAIMRLVQAGAGVALVPRSAAQPWMSRRLRMVRLREPWARRTLLLCHGTDAMMRPGVRTLVEALAAPRA